MKLQRGNANFVIRIQLHAGRSRLDPSSPGRLGDGYGLSPSLPAAKKTTHDRIINYLVSHTHHHREGESVARLVFSSLFVIIPERKHSPLISLTLAQSNRLTRYNAKRHVTRETRSRRSASVGGTLRRLTLLFA